MDAGDVCDADRIADAAAIYRSQFSASDVDAGDVRDAHPIADAVQPRVGFDRSGDAETGGERRWAGCTGRSSREHEHCFARHPYRHCSDGGTESSGCC